MASKTTIKQSAVFRGHIAPVNKVCAYTNRVCCQPCLDGFNYCQLHILEDKSCTFRRCNYTSNHSGKRCHEAASRSDKKDGYCAEHLKRSIYLKQKSSKVRKQQQTPESLLNELTHYCPSPTDIGAAGDSNNFAAGGISSSRRSSSDRTSHILDYASSSDSDNDTVMVDGALSSDNESDADSVDSEQDDLLKHAGVYTAEEVAMITRDKLIRLQSLYIDQFKRLQHLMREKRRAYLHSVKDEQENPVNIHSGKDDPEQEKYYRQLVAMKRYHRQFGKEALIQQQSKERRIAVSEGVNYKSPHFPKCIYPDPGSGLKCGAHSMPLTKYCFKHILHDPNQVLFSACNFANGACNQPSLDLAELNCCENHQPMLPAKRRFPPSNDLGLSNVEDESLNDLDPKVNTSHESSFTDSPADETQDSSYLTNPSTVHGEPAESSSNDNPDIQVDTDELAFINEEDTEENATEDLSDIKAESSPDINR